MKDSGGSRIKRPLFWGGLAAVAVTATALCCPLWVPLSLAAVWLILFGWRRWVFGCLLTVAFLLMAVGYRHLYVTPTCDLDGQVDTLTAVVIDEPRQGSMYLVRVVDSTVLRPNTRVALLCDGEEGPTLYATVTAHVRLYAADGERNAYAAQGAFVRAFPAAYSDRDLHVVGSTETAMHRWMHDLRLALCTACRGGAGAVEGDVLAAVCFGERSYLDAPTTEAFRVSGLNHLLVVSGLHVSMVALALQWLLRRLGRHVCTLLSLAGVWWFAWLVGFSPSVLRAAVMGSMWLIGRWLFCRADGLSSLGLAALVVLAVNPCSVFHVGFQLSFAATLGVLLLARRLTPSREVDRDASWWQRLWYAVRHTAVGGAAVCLSALLFTLPIAVYHYGGFSLTTMMSNILAAAPVGTMMALGWVGTLLRLIPFLSWLGQGVLLVATLLARYVVWVARICSPDWAWVTIPHTWQWGLVCGVCLIAVVGILCRLPVRRWLAAVSMLAVTVLCIGLPITASSVEMTAISLDNEGAFVVTQGDHCALLLTHGRKLDEAVYTAPPFDPDVVFLGDAAAEDVARLSRFPDAATFATDAVAQRANTGSLTACPVGGTITLWEGCRLTLVSADWWHLRVGADAVWICVNPKAAPVDTGETCIYVGGMPTQPPRGDYAVVCSAAWLRRHHPTPTGRENFVVERPTTFVPQEGEWRVSPWL